MAQKSQIAIDNNTGILFNEPPPKPTDESKKEGGGEKKVVTITN